MRKSTWAVMMVGAVAGLAAAVGCSASTGDPGNSGPSNSGGAGTGTGTSGGSGLSSGSNGLSGGNTGGGTFANSLGGNTNTGTPGVPDGGCAGVQQQAEKQEGGRADVIIAVDSSGSMAEENNAVQVNMNQFSQFITSSGIDVHVVLVAGEGMDWSSIPFVGLFAGSFSVKGICIDPPLGAAGACPDGDDTNLPTYMHWREVVDSHNALTQLQNTFSGWRGMLRPDAVKTFVVITDDEAQPADAPGFENWANSQPEFASALWHFSGIFCVTNGSNCANIGNTYHTLQQDTGGIAGDLAQFSGGDINAQFNDVFQQIANVLVAEAVPVDCEWGIPTPPEGEELDPAKVNVQYTNGAGVEKQLYALNDESECVAGTGGWYYDDPEKPARVVACPSSCDEMQADQNARVQVVFGCASEPPPLR